MDKNIVLQNGAIFTYGSDYIIRDVSIPSGVEEVEVCMNISMDDTQKCFPDVKKLIVGDGVSMIDIPNSLFPNVRYVESRSIYFQSSPYLVREFTLKNTFYRDKDDVLDFSYVFKIDGYALCGCKSIKIKNTAAIGDWRSIDKNAFTGSALMEQPFVNGVKMAGRNIVIAVDETAEEVVIPDEKKDNIIFLRGIQLCKVKKMVIHNKNSLSRSYYENGLPQNVVLKTDEYVIQGDIFDLAHASHGTSYTHRFSLESPDYKEVDGVIYTADMKSLVACSLDVESVVIPEGVKTIAYYSFSHSHVKSVKFPDSLEEVERSAFEDCQELERIDFGKGITKIGIDMFRGCKNLKTVVLPRQIKTIRRGAFTNSGLESVTLNNGLEKIEDYAFSGTNIESLRLPESIKDLECWFINDTIKVVNSPVFHSHIVTSVSSSYRKADDFVKLEIAGKCAYLPRHSKPCMYREMQSRAGGFFTDPTQEICTFWDCAYSVKGKESLALMEYEQFGDEEAKSYVKKNSKRFVERLLDEGDEEKTVAFLKTGFVSKVTLKTLLPIAKEKEQMTVQSYILEQMNSKGIAKENLYL